MPNPQTQPRYKIGDNVRVKVGTGLVGLVSEVTGAHSPSGRILYTVRVPMDPEPLKFIVREDEIEEA